MYLSNQSLLVILIVGIVAGWLAGRVMEGGGFGLIGDLIVGLIGAFIGDWLLPRIGVFLGALRGTAIGGFIGAMLGLALGTAFVRPAFGADAVVLGCGVIGAFIGDWLLPRIGVHLGSGIISLILNAFIGAVVLLLLLRLVGGGWGRRRWGRRW